MSITAMAQTIQTNKNIVFIHGAWSTGDVWDNYRLYFEAQGYHTVAPTFRFHEVRTTDSLIGVSMEDYVTDLRKILKLYATPPIVVAHSMGCIIAQRLATEGLVDKLILIAPPVNYGMMTSMKAMKWVNKIEHLDASLAKPSFQDAAYAMLNNLQVDKQKHVYAGMTAESGQVMKELIWIKNLFGKKPNKIEYAKNTAPILFISGGIDRSSPVSIAQKLAKKYKSPTDLKVFENNAHWMIEENNWEETAAYIEYWIEK